MKRLISLMLALCMVSISIVSASANETHTSAEDTDIVTERELMDIPFFFVTSETHSAKPGRFTPIVFKTKDFGFRNRSGNRNHTGYMIRCCPCKGHDHSIRVI